MYSVIICSLILIYFIFKIFIKNKVIIISVDGNIGSGKSTLVKYLKSKYKKNLYFLDEPVEEWIRITDDKNENILQKFYSDKSRYSYLFQNFAFITRANILLKNIKYLKNFFGKKIIVTERSVETDRNIFAKMLYDSNNLTDLEYKIYNYWYNNLYPDIKVKNIIYLKTDPEVAYQRIKKRNRKEEEGISLEYIKNVHNYHEKWLSNYCYNICVLDGNIENYQSHNQKIINFVNRIP